MTYFKWGDDLSVGNSFIDHDHRHLIQLVNDLHTATSRGDGRNIVGNTLAALINYTKEHFQREEHHMELLKYPKIDEHKLQHNELLEQVMHLRAQFDTGHITVAAQVSALLRDWLSVRIRRSDKDFASALKK